MITEMSRRIEIDMGHRVPDHASKCRNLHGHRYVIEAIVMGELASEGEQTGMVLDFGFMKEIMMRRIDRRYDHALCLWKEDPLVVALGEFDEDGYYMPSVLNEMLGFDHKVVLTDVVPTAENLAHIWMKSMEQDVIDESYGRARLVALKVWETPNGTATAYSTP